MLLPLDITIKLVSVCRLLCLKLPNTSRNDVSMFSSAGLYVGSETRSNGASGVTSTLLAVAIIKTAIFIFESLLMDGGINLIKTSFFIPFSLPYVMFSRLHFILYPVQNYNVINIIVLFVETPRKFIICSNKLTWCFHKQNYYIFYRHANIQRT
jgi:hypothetical protein